MSGFFGNIRKILSGKGPRKMRFQQIDSEFAVAPQITTGDIAAIAEAGFKSLVCNRPDTESGAVPHEDIAKLAAEAGIEFRYIPVGGFDGNNPVVEMVGALKEMPRPMLAYCRSGARSANLYMAASQGAR